jgi:hypothetical protein
VLEPAALNSPTTSSGRRFPFFALYSVVVGCSRVYVANAFALFSFLAADGPSCCCFPLFPLEKTCLCVMYVFVLASDRVSLSLSMEPGMKYPCCSKK